MSFPKNFLWRASISVFQAEGAKLEDGSWKIIEAGDGQVSGLAEHQDYEQYFKVLYEYLNE